MRLIIHFLTTVLALMLAVWILPDMYVQGTNALLAFAVMALILGVINVFLKPLITILSIGFIIVTLGLFMLVINAAVLWFSAWVCVHWLSIGFHIDNFWTAIWGSIIVSVLSFMASFFVKKSTASSF